ncbi:hypothetical protein D1J60_33100 [Streptomyces sp. W1SF4]|nr:hypothetical protein D1J60_33100 [Streptomyces sp. W1SF4]
MSPRAPRCFRPGLLRVARARSPPPPAGLPSGAPRTKTPAQSTAVPVGGQRAGVRRAAGGGGASVPGGAGQPAEFEKGHRDLHAGGDRQGLEERHAREPQGHHHHGEDQERGKQVGPRDRGPQVAGRAAAGGRRGGGTRGAAFLLLFGLRHRPFSFPRVPSCSSPATSLLGLRTRCHSCRRARRHPAYRFTATAVRRGVAHAWGRGGRGGVPDRAFGYPAIG